MVIHRDLKPENIGVDSAGRLKLFDFGLGRCVKKRSKDTESYKMTGETGTLRYMAPEVVLSKPYTEKVDTYSFGIVVWTMATNTVAFAALTAGRSNKQTNKQTISLSYIHPLSHACALPPPHICTLSRMHRLAHTPSLFHLLTHSLTHLFIPSHPFSPPLTPSHPF